jgi:ketosteroid isomerase-like protein
MNTTAADSLPQPKTADRARWPGGSEPVVDASRHNHAETATGRVDLVNRDRVMRWVAGYERAWREGDRDAIAELFTEDARYYTSPDADAEVGHAAIRALWLRDQGETFAVRAEPVAVEGRDAVVRLRVRYGDPVRQEYRDLWVLRFAADGRVEYFEEWYWPGKLNPADTNPT